MDTCYYYITNKFVNKILRYKIYSNNITIYFEKEKIVKHNKNLRYYQLIIDSNHYPIILFRKLSVLINSCAFNQIDLNIKNIYNSYLKINRGIIGIILKIKTCLN